MKITAGVLTRNAITHGRCDMLIDAVASLAEADRVVLLDNGSDDGSVDWVKAHGGVPYRSTDGVTSCGRGMNALAGLCIDGADVVVLTSEDMVWRPGWRRIVEDFWTHADDHVVLLCGLLEPLYPWSPPTGTYRAGGVVAVTRTCVPGSGWTFRTIDWPTIGPVPEIPGEDDVPTCARLHAAGRLLAAVDIADHIGEHQSTWGNQSHRFAKPLHVDEPITTLP